MKSNRTVNIVIQPRKINDFLGLIWLGAALLAISISSAYSDRGGVVAGGDITVHTPGLSLATKGPLVR